MKHIYYILSLAFLLNACAKNENSNLDLVELNRQKTELKQQLDGINKELKKLEEAIVKLDTAKKSHVVTSISPKLEDFNHYIEVQGTVKADKSVEMHPEMGGTINRIFVKEGQKVSKGQVLAQLDASVLNNNISQAQTQLSLAATTFDRQERLWKQNIGSEIQYLQAKASKESLENNVRALQSQAKKMKIIAPFSGTIDEVFAKVGELASPQMTFLRLINLKEIYLESEITETYLQDIKKGTEVIINFPSLNKEINAKISQVGNFINPNNRSFKARVDIDNSDSQIKANLLANIRINDFQANGIVLPSHTILEDSQGNMFVYTLLKEDSYYRVKKTLIKVGKEYNNQSYISEGLTVNDLIVDKGSRLVKNEDEVLLAK